MFAIDLKRMEVKRVYEKYFFHFLLTSFLFYLNKSFFLQIARIYQGSVWFKIRVINFWLFLRWISNLRVKSWFLAPAKTLMAVSKVWEAVFTEMDVHVRSGALSWGLLFWSGAWELTNMKFWLIVYEELIFRSNLRIMIGISLFGRF